MDEFCLEDNIVVIQGVLKKDKDINKKRFRACLGDLFPGQKKIINGIMTVFEADFFDELRVLNSVNVMLLQRYIDNITSTCYMLGNDAKRYILLWFRILGTDVRELKEGSYIRLCQEIYGREINYPDDLIESVDYVLSSMNELEQMVIRKKYDLDVFDCMVAQNEEVSNITEKKAREIESKVFWKMRTSWYSRIIITGLSEIQRLRQRRLFGEDQPDEEILNMSIEELNFSTNRISRSLKSNDITTVGMLCEKTFDDISHISGFGKKSLEEVVQRLWVLGLHLKEMAVDLNGNEIECLRGYPENIVNIVLKKPMAWERTLYYETVLFHYEKIISQQKDFLAKNTDSDIFLDQRFGLMKFILDKEDELLGYCDDKNLPIDVNKVLEKLENPVEPQMILNISERVMRIYKNALMWCRQVEAVKTVTIFDSVMVAFVNWGRQVLSCFETWIAQVRVGCKEIKELELGKITEDELTGTSLSVKAADEQVLKEFAKISENINLFDQENIVVKFLKVDYDSKDNLIFTLKMFCENMSDEPISLSMHYLIIENGKRVCDDWIDSFDFDGAYYYEVGEAKVVEYDIEMINYQGESGAFVIKFYISIEDEEGMELYDTCELNIIYQYRTGVLLAFESV